jgi:hypothetical protein
VSDRRQTEQWWVGARELGFSLRDDSNGNSMVPHWDTMAASLRPHTQLSEHNWMVGTFEGLPAMVTYYFRDGGSSADTHYTHAMIQIDPPLFLGLHVAPRGWLCGVPLMGVPIFDDKLYAKAFQPERGHAIVWPGRHPPVTDIALSAIAKKTSPEIYDSFAAVTTPSFAANQHVLRDMLRDASLLARAAIERRAMIGDTREEAAIKNAWAHFAERERLTFDAPRRSLHGNFEGFDASLYTRSTPTALWNQVLLALPTDTGMHVDVSPESGLTRFGNVIGFSDIEVGDPHFDRALRVKGNPPPLVKTFFARPETRTTALGLVEKYGRFSIHGRFISVGTVRPAVTEADLRTALSDVAMLARAATGQAPPQQGPYRA